MEPWPKRVFATRIHNDCYWNLKNILVNRKMTFVNWLEFKSCNPIIHIHSDYETSEKREKKIYAEIKQECYEEIKKFCNKNGISFSYWLERVIEEELGY
jgi:small-conductance mechanosensitive channel